jgi:hypothetical protein
MRPKTKLAIQKKPKRTTLIPSDFLSPSLYAARYKKTSGFGFQRTFPIPKQSIIHKIKKEVCSLSKKQVLQTPRRKRSIKV